VNASHIIIQLQGDELFNLQRRQLDELIALQLNNNNLGIN